MFGASVVVILSVLSFSVNAQIVSEKCNVTEDTAVCVDLEFPLNVDDGITRLVVRSTHLETVEKADLEKYTELTTIDFSGCSINHIDPEALTLLKSLQEINLSSNKKLKLPTEGSFLNSESLIKLNLSDNAIDVLPDDVFQGLPNVEEIDLSFNQLKNISATSLLKLTHLKTLIVLKDDNIHTKDLCENTKLEKVIRRKADEDDETIDCASQRNNNTDTEVHDGPAKVEASTPEDNITTEEPKNVDTGTSDVTEKPGDEKTNEKPNKEPKKDSEGPIETPPKEPDTKEEIPEEIPEDKENAPQLNETVTKPEPKTHEDTETKTDETKEQSETDVKVAPNPENPHDHPHHTSEESSASQEVIKPSNVQTYSIKNQDDGNEPSNKMNEHIKDTSEKETDRQQESTSADSISHSGTNIILGIILCVMVVGAVGFGYKYWKNRRGYRTANTEDNLDDAKELQTIVTHSPTDGDEK